MTYQGIVLEVDAAKAEAVRVHVKTIDAKTKKEENVWFTLGKSTKVKRGDRSLTVAAAKIVKDERIVVIVDHDDSDKVEVKEVRLAAQTR
jgi:hypothetical protein